jgi:hypothetical protein
VKSDESGGASDEDLHDIGKLTKKGGTRISVRIATMPRRQPAVFTYNE